MKRPRYDRELLLLGTKRNTVLELWEVRRYGSDSYGDADHVSIYGMRPASWYEKGIRVLGRTAVECTRDLVADAIGTDVAAIAATHANTTRILVVDPFAGSGNTLYWLLRHLPGARAMGFESDATVFQLTEQNVSILGLPIDVVKTDWTSGLAGLSVTPHELLIGFIAPPWGDALETTAGLDLRRTTPPVVEIVDSLLSRFSQHHFLCATQIYETTRAVSIAELRDRFDWSTVRVYSLDAPGQNHGIVVGTKGWTPSG